MMGGQLFEKPGPRGEWAVLKLETGGDSALVYFIDDQGRYAAVLHAAPSHAWILHYVAQLLPLLGHGAEAWEALMLWAEHRSGKKRTKGRRDWWRAVA